LIVDWSRPCGAGRAKAPCSSSGYSTVGSAISESLIWFSDGPKCFFPDTALHLSTGEIIPAMDLTQGCFVRGDGEVTRASRIRHHPEQLRDVVELRVGSATLVVTSGHRIMVQPSGARANRRDVAVEYLKVGDLMLCMSGPRSCWRFKAFPCIRPSLKYLSALMCPSILSICPQIWCSRRVNGVLVIIGVGYESSCTSAKHS